MRRLQRMFAQNTLQRVILSLSNFCMAESCDAIQKQGAKPRRDLYPDLLSFVLKVTFLIATDITKPLIDPAHLTLAPLLRYHAPQRFGYVRAFCLLDAANNISELRSG